MKLNALTTLLYITLIFCACTSAKAQQQTDTVGKVPTPQLPIYPRLKYLSVTYDQAGEADYTVKNTGRPENEGTITRGRLQVQANIPIWKKNGFTLSATELYTHEELYVKETVNPIFEGVGKNYSFEDFITTVNGSYIGKLFGKPWISGASAIVGSADFIHPEKLTGLITSMLVFQKKPNTRYTLGIAVIADPSTQIPAFPIIAYWHRFADPRWEVDMILPSSLKIRRSDVLGGWLSAGSEFNGFGYFLTDLPNTSKTFQNTYSEVSFGIAYERIFAKNFMFSLQAGYKATLQNRILEVYKRYSDATVKVDMGAAPYIKAGISFIITNEKVKKEIQKNF